MCRRQTGAPGLENPQTFTSLHLSFCSGCLPEGLFRVPPFFFFFSFSFGSACFDKIIFYAKHGSGRAGIMSGGAGPFAISYC